MRDAAATAIALLLTLLAMIMTSSVYDALDFGASWGGT
jgi:hypothetical protein